MLATHELDDLLVKLDRERRAMRMESEGRPVVAFDADGTIWEGDVGIEAFERLARTRDVRPLAAQALRAEALRAGLDVGDLADENDLAVRLLEAFFLDQLEPCAAFAMMAWAFAGRSREQMHDFAVHVVREASLARRAHVEVVEVARWARANGVQVWVVSASPEAVIRASLGELGFPADEVVAMAPRVSDGVLQPAVGLPIPYGAGKVAAVAKRLEPKELLAAFGDSAADLSLLSLARVPVAVRPQAALRQAAHRVPSLTELRLRGDGA